MSDGELKTEFQFIPRVKFEYAKGGESTECQFITLYAPTSKFSKQCSALKQAFFRSVINRGDNKGGDKADEKQLETVSGDEIIMAIAQSVDVDLAEMMDVGKSLLAGTNLAKVDGEAKLTNHMIDSMSQDDVENMVGEYMVNFILASSLEKMRNILSATS